jgi:hypothetical protein
VQSCRFYLAWGCLKSLRGLGSAGRGVAIGTSFDASDEKRDPVADPSHSTWWKSSPWTRTFQLFPFSSLREYLVSGIRVMRFSGFSGPKGRKNSAQDASPGKQPPEATRRCSKRGGDAQWHDILSLRRTGREGFPHPALATAFARGSRRQLHGVSSEILQA